MEIFWTVISGVSIFVLGQVVQTFFIKPIYDFKVILGSISHKVKFHSNVITNSGIRDELVNWSSGDMRDLSCNLESRYLAIPFHDIFSQWGILPKRSNIKEAAGLLILLANTTGHKGDEVRNADTIDKLKKLLGIVL